MALVRNWHLKSNLDLQGQIELLAKSLDLRGCKKIQVKFDPFREDCRHIRDFNHHILSYHAIKSNINLPVRTEILTDRSEPTITVDLINGEKLLMKCAHLTVLDIFNILNEQVTPLAPKEEVSGELKVKTGKVKRKK